MHRQETLLLKSGSIDTSVRRNDFFQERFCQALLYSMFFVAAKKRRGKHLVLDSMLALSCGPNSLLVDKSLQHVAYLILDGGFLDAFV